MNTNKTLDTILEFIYIENGMKIAGYKTQFTFLECYPIFHMLLMEKGLDAYIMDLPAPEDVTELDMKEILEKLALDGHLTRQAYLYNNEWQKDSYHTTFEGRWFIQQGGYAEKLRVLEAESRKTDFYEKQTFENTLSVTRLTYWIAGGTIVAAVYYILEILKNHISVGLSSRSIFALILSHAIVGIIVWLIAKRYSSTAYKK